MNKKLIILGVAVLLICVGLSGCNELSKVTNPDLNRFVGTWKGDMETITFFSDGTFDASMDDGTYEIKDGKLVVTNYVSGTKYVKTYEYSFSNNDNTLNLLDLMFDITYVYTKQ